MVSKKDTLDRLNMEKDYEDQLVRNLDYYFIAVLDDIAEITEEERNKIRVNLETIRFDSVRHSDMFNMLIQKVFESENDNF
jgi:hypothetical protein